MTRIVISNILILVIFLLNINLITKYVCIDISMIEKKFILKNTL
jgi:hypothetical protein